MSDIFISYSRRDTVRVQLIKTLIEEEGLQAWMDTSALYGSDSWSAQIAHAIEECKLLVVVISSNSVVSQMVAKEVLLAQQEGKRILPVMLEDTPLTGTLKFVLTGVQHVKADDPDDIRNSVKHALVNPPGLRSFTSSPRLSGMASGRGSTVFEEYRQMGHEDRISGTRDQLLLGAWNAPARELRVKARAYINGFYEPSFADGDTEEFYELEIEGNGTSGAIVKTLPDRKQLAYLAIGYTPEPGASPNVIDGDGTYHFWDLQIQGQFYGNSFTNRAARIHRDPINIKIRAYGIELACAKFFDRYRLGPWRLLPKEFYEFIFGSH